MAKKQDAYYFENFVACAEYSSAAADLLCEIMGDFDEAKLSDYMEKMHTIEHSADLKKHELTEALIKAFITPIDREDIIQVSHNLDELTDKIEDVLVRMYLNRVKSINPNAIEMATGVKQCCDEVLALMSDFSNYKHSKKLREHMININSLEEKLDRLYMSSMYSLTDERSDALYVLAWRDIYNYLEKCADTAEHIADIVETVVMKNS